MNQAVATQENDNLHNVSLQLEIYELLCREGPLTNGAVAERVGLTPWKCRPHLDEMKDRGEIRYNILGGRYSV